jgi:hypothetical protein
MALQPEDYDFVSNFSTLWAIFLGAILATLGGFGATQIEWYLESRRRERNAALFFAEFLTTLRILLDMTSDTRKIGDPYGPVTMRMLRSSRREIDLYDRNREMLFDLKDANIRARIHTLVLRIGMICDGVFDTTNELQTVDARLQESRAEAERRTLEERMVFLKERRAGGFDFLIETSQSMKPIVVELEPLAKQSFEGHDALVRNV